MYVILKLSYFQTVPTNIWVSLIKERLEKEDCISKVLRNGILKFNVN